MKHLIAACGALVTTLAGAAPAAPADCCNIVELRQYITYPGQRDVLIKLFEREFIESQEAVGIRVMGTFRDLNDPHRFTWVRGFDSMAQRKQALGDFYYGALWKSFAAQANATLYDNDDVLLLHPASPGSGFATSGVARPGREASAPQSGLVIATLYYFRQEVPAEFIARFDAELAPVFTRSGAHILARLVSEKSPNTFERLPVREDVNVFVWFARFADRADWERFQARLAGDGRWRDTLFAPLYKGLARAPETILLQPTARSLVR